MANSIDAPAILLEVSQATRQGFQCLLFTNTSLSAIPSELAEVNRTSEFLISRTIVHGTEPNQSTLKPVPLYSYETNDDTWKPIIDHQWSHIVRYHRFRDFLLYWPIALTKTRGLDLCKKPNTHGFHHSRTSTLFNATSAAPPRSAGELIAPASQPNYWTTLLSSRKLWIHPLPSKAKQNLVYTWISQITSESPA